MAGGADRAGAVQVLYRLHPVCIARDVGNQPNFSKVLYVVTLHREYTRALTFENFSIRSSSSPSLPLGSPPWSLSQALTGGVGWGVGGGGAGGCGRSARYDIASYCLMSLTVL